MKTHTLLVLAILSLLFLTNCKKGEDDPSFSFRSRKARLTGDWHIESGTVNLTYDSKKSPAYSQRYTFSNSQLTMHEAYNGSGSATIYTGVYTLEMSFKKDSKFVMTENYAGTIVKASGSWNFTSGVGKAKNKDGISVQLDEVTAGSSYVSLFNKGETTFNYHLKQLSNKKIVLESAVGLEMSVSGAKAGYSGSYTLIQ